MPRSASSYSDKHTSNSSNNSIRHRAATAYVAAAGVVALFCLVTLCGLQASVDPHSLRVFRAGAALRSSFSRLIARSQAQPQLPPSEFVELDDVESYGTADANGQPFDVHELMTPELIAQIKSRENDCLAPVHVHLLWIGDLEKAPKDRLKYIEMGYNLTVHTSADEILDGFQPYVKRAYRKALPSVVGHDFLKFAMLYKYGGFSVDADTSPVIPASEVKFPSDCELLFGKEYHLHRSEKPVYREVGDNDYGFSRPFQVLNWAMAVSKPRNKHIKWLLQAAMMHFFGLRDMEKRFIQDISGSGLMTDYVAFLHEREGRSYPLVYEDPGYVPVDGLCLADDFLDRTWIHHSLLGSWKWPGAH